MMCANRHLVALICGGFIFFLVIRSIRRLYFHPLSKLPGPKLAAISDLWLAYHSLSGRWPWAIESVIKKHGDVVRIAPNELVFFTPQALADLYGSHDKFLERFPKTQINNHGNDEHGGLIWEWEPLRHRQVAKKMSPAFSTRALQAKEVIIHKYVDLFVERMEEFGGRGVSLPMWINWICVDISADMAYNREMNALKDVKDPPYLSLLMRVHRAMVVIQLSWRFPLISPLKYPYLIMRMMGHSQVRAHSREQLEKRIRRRGAIEHLDFIEQLIPADREPPKGKALRHLEQVAGQLLLAGYEPPSLWFFFTIYGLLQSPRSLETLSQEIRHSFKGYDEITATSTANLPYLTACLKESLRFTPPLLTGMPVVSPGASVDGTYVPRGVVCQSSSFALARSERHFRHPLQFRPERWITVEDAHPLYDPQFVDDDLKAFNPFSQGPRMCVGREIAWWQIRVFLAKVLWKFDMELMPGTAGQVDMDRDLKGWGMYEKPDVHVAFSPARPKNLV